MGYDDAAVFFQDPDGPLPGFLTSDFQIPLNLLHGFFNPLGEPLIPAVMASGLRIEIDLESPRGAIVNTFGTGFTTVSSYEITDCYFNLMSTSLMDSAVAAVNANAAKNSLEYLYLDLFTSTNSQSANNTTVNIDVNKSVALLNEAITVVQLQSQLNTLYDDQFKTTYYPGSWWYQLGSQQFPNQKNDTFGLSYHQALVCFDKMKNDDKECDVDGIKFLEEHAIWANSFERNSALSLSQVPCNASRSLRFELTYTEPLPDSSIVTVYLEYVTSSRSTLLNSRIDI
jgi:hypothetical protein